MLYDHLFCYESALLNYLFNLSVYQTLDFLAIGFKILNLRESNVADLLLHAKFGHNLVG